MKLDDKIVAALLSDVKVFDLWKDLADAGGMLMFGIKDAAHFEKVMNKAAADLKKAHWKEINKHKSDSIPKKPNRKRSSKKPFPSCGKSRELIGVRRRKFV